MKHYTRTSLFVLLAAAPLAVFAGCSDDSTSTGSASSSTSSGTGGSGASGGGGAGGAGGGMGGTGSGTGGSSDTCGDGSITGAETCDDGNATAGDGCSASCVIEEGFECLADLPSVCTAICGDGLVRGAETCDDGNKDPGDGCDAACATEAGYQCKEEPSQCCLPSPEICDGLDNDCTGVADEGCNCIDGTTQDCYTGPMGTQGMGICVGGTQTCVNGNYGACVGEVLPAMEVCDGMDQNCDGTPDNGVGCVCLPGTTKSCYSGPMNTENVGQCKSGVAACAADGKSYGACVGEVLPAALENCATAADDNCDGAAPACTGAHMVSKTFGDASIQQGYAVATDPMGNVYVTGAYTGTIDFGAGVLTSAGGNDVFVAKFNPQGMLAWAKSYGATGDQSGNGIAVDAMGNAYVVGTYANNVTFGAFPVTNAGGDDIFVLKLSTTGTEMFANGYGNNATQQGNGIAVDPMGNVVVTGLFGGSFAVGGTTVNSAGNFDTLVFKMDSAGVPMWAKSFGATQNQGGKSVATDASGNIIVAGYYETGIDFGGGALANGGNEDAFVAKLSPNGAHIWSKGYGAAQNQRSLGVATDATGAVVLVGYFAGNIDLGAGAVTSGGGDDGFILKLDAAGAVAWSKTFGGGSAQRAKGAAIDAVGNIIVTGEYFGPMNFLGNTVTAAGMFDGFIAKLSGAGNQVWFKKFGNASNDRGEAVAVDSQSNVWATGSIIGNVDFGGGNLAGGAAENVFLVEYAP